MANTPLCAESLQRVEGAYDFYNLGLGTVAFLPRAQSQADCNSSSHFLVLPQSGAYNLPEQSGEYWFIVSNKASQRIEKTYLGVEIIAVEKRPPIADVLLNRNENWERADDPAFGKIKPPKRFEGQKDLSEFFRLHLSGQLADVDQHFFKWHGTPVGSDESSWKMHRLWVPSQLAEKGDGHGAWNFRPLAAKFQPAFSGDDPLQLDAYLIGFKISPSPSRGNRLCFEMTGVDRKGAYVRLFVPDREDFDRQFFIRFSH
jgi:hypothetical protein